MGGHEPDPLLEHKLHELSRQVGTQVADLNSVKTCEVCDNTFTKTLPGRDICGTCQVAMAVVLHHEQYLYHRWGVINLGR